MKPVMLHTPFVRPSLVSASFVSVGTLILVMMRWIEQIGVPLDPDCLYGTTPPPSRQEQDDSLAGDTSEIATKANVHVNELDLGGFSQLSVVEEMLDRGMGLDAGLQGIAMTRCDTAGIFTVDCPLSL